MIHSTKTRQEQVDVNRYVVETGLTTLEFQLGIGPGSEVVYIFNRTCINRTMYNFLTLFYLMLNVHLKEAPGIMKKI